MKVKSICSIIVLLCILLSCEEEDEVVKTYVYLNSSYLFSPPSESKWVSWGTHAGIFVDDHTEPGLLTTLSFKTDGGDTYSVNLNDVYNLYTTNGAGDPEPIEIPNRDYTMMTIDVRNAITGMRYNPDVYGDYTILGRAPISGTFDISNSGLYQVNTMQNYEPFVSPSGKIYNGLVRTVNLVSDTQISVNDTKDENYYEYAPDISVYTLNPDKQSDGSSGCLEGTWERSICGGTQKSVVTFNGGTGTFRDEDCAGVCASPGRFFTFTYQILSDSEMRITYTSGQICGQSNIPDGGVQTYSCNGATLLFGNTYTKR